MDNGEHPHKFLTLTYLSFICPRDFFLFFILKILKKDSDSRFRIWTRKGRQMTWPIRRLRHGFGPHIRRGPPTAVPIRQAAFVAQRKSRPFPSAFLLFFFSSSLFIIYIYFNIHRRLVYRSSGRLFLSLSLSLPLFASEDFLRFKLLFQKAKILSPKHEHKRAHSGF
jgi:hypothetical protein